MNIKKNFSVTEDKRLKKFHMEELLGYYLSPTKRR